MILVNPGRDVAELHQMQAALKEFRESPFGKWFALNLEVWKQKTNQNREVNGDEYRGIMQTLMDIQLLLANRGRLEGEIQRRLEPKEEKPKPKENWNQKVLKQ